MFDCCFSHIGYISKFFENVQVFLKKNEKKSKKKRADHFSGLHAVKYILCLFLFTVSCTNFRCTTTHGDTHVCDTVFALHEVYTVAFLYPKHLSGLKRILIGGEEKEFPFVDILLVFNALFDICGAELFAGIS